MRYRLAALAITGFLAAWAAGADVVHFKTGRSIEGVIAEETATQVRIRLAFGEITVPRDTVERIERTASPLEVYFARRRELLEEAGEAAAEDWLALARWARAQGLAHSSREAALQAAEIDPRLEGLAALMAAFDFVFDEQSGRWISFGESMRRQGFVEHRGSWISRQEMAEIERARRAEAEAHRQARLALALQAERERRIAEEAAHRALAQQAQLMWWGPPFGFHSPFVGVSGFVVPPFFHHPGFRKPGPEPDVEPPPPPDPATPTRPRTHRGGFSREQIERPPGSLRSIGMEPHRPGSLRPPVPLDDGR